MYLTFKVTNNKIVNFIKYIVALLGFNIIDAFMVKIFTEKLQLYYVYSIVAVTIVLLIIKFIVFDRVVFSRRSE